MNDAEEGRSSGIGCRDLRVCAGHGARLGDAVMGALTFPGEFRSVQAHYPIVFRREPAGRHVLKMCRAEACQAAGGERLAAHVEAKLGIPFGSTTADGRVTLEPIYCLGLCSVAPSAMLDGKIHGRLDERKLDALIAQADR